MKHRLTALAMAGALMGTFAIAPISAVMAGQTSKQLIAQKPTSDLLQAIPVTGTLAGSQFTGTLKVTSLAYDPESGTLLVNGILNGTNGTVNLVDQSFEDAPATLSTSSTKAASCDILFLDIGPISLDLLGLTIDLSQITLDINAVPGSGNLLGNLLCSLAGLLDGGPLAGILQLINQINDILSSL